MAWLRDLQSETSVYLALRRKGLIIDLTDEDIFGYVQRVLTSAEVLFFSPENSTIASGEVNTILLSPSAHSMADARHNTLFSALNIPFRPPVLHRHENIA